MLILSAALVNLKAGCFSYTIMWS